MTETETETEIEVSRTSLTARTCAMLDDMARRGHEIPGELMTEILDVLRTVQRLHWNWWSYDFDCGCLIGTVLHRRGSEATPEADLENRIGTKFLDVWNGFVIEAMGEVTNRVDTMRIID